MTTPYVYRLTDIVNGKRYIGVRTASGCDPADLGVKYFTSSKVVRYLFQSNPQRFKKQIIVTGDKEYVIRVEKTLIDLYDAVVSEDFYNRSNAKMVHPDDNKAGGLKSKRERLGFHSFTFEQFSEHNRANGLKSLKQRKGVHARSKEQMSADGKKSYLLKVGVHARTFEQMSEVGRKNANKLVEQRKGMFSMSFEERSKLGKATGHLSSVKRYKCCDCSMVSTAAGLGNHLKKAKHSGKTTL